MDPWPSAYAYMRLPAQRSPVEDLAHRTLNQLALTEGYCLEGVWVDHGCETNSFDAMMSTLPAAPVRAIFTTSWGDLEAIPRFVNAPHAVICRYFGLPVFTLDVHEYQRSRLLDHGD